MKSKQPRISAALLYQFLLKQTGSSESDLQLAFIKHYQLDRVLHTQQLPEHARVMYITPDFQITATRYNKITEIRRRKLNLSAPKKLAEPEAHVSKPSAPTVVYRRRKTMLPH